MATFMGHYMFMKIANIAEFKNNLGKYLGAVEGGEVVEIRKRNVPLARVVPIPRRQQNKTVLGVGLGTAVIRGDLTQPLMPEGDWDMLNDSEPPSP